MACTDRLSLLSLAGQRLPLSVSSHSPAMAKELVGEAAASGNIVGAGVMAAALKHHGVQYMFGVVGIPIIEVSTHTRLTHTASKKSRCSTLNWQWSLCCQVT